MTIDAQANLRTLRDVLRFAVTRFNESGLSYGHGQADAFEEAAFIVLRTLKLPLDRLEFFADAYLTHAEINSLLQTIERRVKKRLPAAYLLNEAWLMGYKFYVDESVIIPRSFIGELLRDDLQPWVEDRTAVADILDLCTGSGCLAVMAADTFPNAKVDAVDISDAALKVARRNVDDYHFDDRITLLKSDLFEALPSKRYDVIISNPPYVTDAAMAKLPKEYTHEPTLALAGGPDGMAVVKNIVRQARGHLKRNGLLFVEVGDGRDEVERVLGDIPLTWLSTSAGDDMVFMARQEELP
ncbi:MAG: 50S ribosomal protein L3 N(5)-glutamine methyltransferase [Burkholderiaceae bacterium]|jgi:ribosomal protein L3 glutamine methyltransferase|nr:50S ribosomal protein L3 N(5)-glutamine methyltransferase [Burkholderiaceae bacterium]MDH5207039.1 50S ribosomal protein L3 N(5)-glutamine methyltransferase [Burkholderiaceae bacterium]